MKVDLQQVWQWLEEDLGSGDITAALTPEKREAVAEVVAKEPLVLCGREWFGAIFQLLDPACHLHWEAEEGEWVEAGRRICRIEGRARALLSGERTALNLLQTLSGTATLARRFAEAVKDLPVKLLDTRKTLPGLRALQKYAVRIGGCENHRMGLYDAVLLKENHLRFFPSLKEAVHEAKRRFPELEIEVEVENLDQLEEALEAGADLILLDNFTLEELRQAVQINRGRARLEASGNVTLENVRQIAETGVDRISVGALTKNVEAVDLSMRMVEEW